MKKINKTVARKLFNSKKPVIIIPCKCHPGGVWFTGFEMENDGSRSFDQFVNEFTYYNCNSELGNRPAFYVYAEGANK